MKMLVAAASLLVRLLVLAACLSAAIIIAVFYDLQLTRAMLDAVTSMLVYAVATRLCVYTALVLVMVGWVVWPVANLVRGWAGWWASALLMVAGILACCAFMAASQGLLPESWPERLVNYSVWVQPKGFTAESVGQGAALLAFTLAVMVGYANVMKRARRRQFRKRQEALLKRVPAIGSTNPPRRVMVKQRLALPSPLIVT